MSWPVVKLGGLVSHVSSGATPKGGSENYSNSGPVMFLRSQNIHMNELRLDDVIYINEDTHKKMKRSVVQYGDVLLNITGASIGRVAPFELKGVEVNSNQHVCTIRPLPEVLDYKYLSYFLGNSKFQEGIFSSQRGGTREALNYSQIRDFEIPLPPLEEQKRIAAILVKADAIRRKRHQAIKLADNFLRSVFLEMFGDPVTNPKGLKVVSLIELCEKVTDGTHQSPKWEGSGIPFLFISNIVDGKISYETSKYISESTYNLLTKSTPIETGDILYTTVGSYGNVALVREDNRFCFQRHIAHIKPNLKKVDPNFLSEMLSSSVVRKQADRLVKGVAQKTLNLKDLKGIKVFDVDFSGQNEFLEKSKKIIGFKNRSHHSLSNSELFFNALSQKAFSGKL